MKKRILILVAVLCFILSALGCSASKENDTDTLKVETETTKEANEVENASGEKTQEEYGEVVIQNGDRTITFTTMPQKVLCCNLYSAENMAMLGLEDYIVAKNVPASDAETPLPELADKFTNIAEVEPSHENAVALDTDLIIGQVSAFKESKWGSYEMFDNKGINTYTITGTIVGDETIEDVYTDIENLGKIFKVEDKAEALIKELKKEVEDVSKTVGELIEEDKVKVFVMDSFNGNEIYTTSA